ncbi:hypothetical protein EVAR_81781_1 [Eumeta japonica]|uniref:Uncharacterized protein n=1 Tax=Eumeta variegata TaxID=151549 RepID=A0A4C1UIH8_EUMVA|nr:hypothetical protein EVAR_81781_1 [Eumeta japonica]
MCNSLIKNTAPQTSIGLIWPGVTNNDSPRVELPFVIVNGLRSISKLGDFARPPPASTALGQHPRAVCASGFRIV